MTQRFVALKPWYQRNQPVLRAGMIVEIERVVLSGHSGDPQPDEQVNALVYSAATGHLEAPRALFAPLKDDMWVFSTEEDQPNTLRNVTTGGQIGVSEAMAKLMEEEHGSHFRFNMYFHEGWTKFVIYPRHEFDAPLLSPAVNLPGVKSLSRFAGAVVE